APAEKVKAKMKLQLS
ncbi:hypothetical protein A2U01_0032216, partial [Trifolium medium]|nr:hypothetical protein [Trifolium medium]